MVKKKTLKKNAGLPCLLEHDRQKQAARSAQETEIQNEQEKEKENQNCARSRGRSRCDASCEKPRVKPDALETVLLWLSNEATGMLTYADVC